MGAKGWGQEISKPIQLKDSNQFKHAYKPLIMLDVIQRKTKDFYISHAM